MGHKIQIDVAKLDAQYEEMMNDIFLLHHTYPTNLTKMNLTDADRAAMGEASAYANNAKQPQRKGKKVHFESDPDYCNGLPRRKR